MGFLEDSTVCAHDQGNALFPSVFHRVQQLGCRVHVRRKRVPHNRGILDNLCGCILVVVLVDIQGIGNRRCREFSDCDVLFVAHLASLGEPELPAQLAHRGRLPIAGGTYEEVPARRVVSVASHEDGVPQLVHNRVYFGSHLEEWRMGPVCRRTYGMPAVLLEGQQFQKEIIPCVTRRHHLSPRD